MANVLNAFSVAQKIATKKDADVVLFNGTISAQDVLSFVERIFAQKRHPNLILLMVTDGGDPDAAYKMSRYIQRQYTHITLVVSGYCKSAGTLMAVGAHEVAFAPYGELGPLDIQTYLTDNLSAMESGLTITEAIETLVRKSTDLHREHYTKIMNSTGRVVSFASAAKVATEFSTALFSPIFARIDPYDVGQKTRSMRIANDYGERLTAKSKGLKDGALDKLIRGYPSHSFVIDCEEAKELFKQCRTLTEDEGELIDALGAVARQEFRTSEPLILFLSTVDNGDATTKGGDDADESPDGDDGGNSGSAGGAVPDASSEVGIGADDAGIGMGDGDEPAAPGENE